MSDESSPPLLRLKPRARLEPDASTAQQSSPIAEPPLTRDQAPAPSAVASAADSALGATRLRLKPKLTSEEAPAHSVPSAPEPAAAAPAPVQAPAKPIISLRPAAPSSAPTPAPIAPPPAPAASASESSPTALTNDEAPASKLKISLQRTPSTVSVPPPPPPAVSPADTKPRPPPFPVVASTTAEAATPPPLPPPLPPPAKFEPKPHVVPHLRAPQRMLDGTAAKQSSVTAEKAESKRSLPKWIPAVGLVVLLMGGLFGFRYYRHSIRPQVAPTPASSPATTASTSTKPAPTAATVAATAPTKGTPSTATPPPAPVSNPNPTPSETLNTLAHAPAQAIAKAQKIIDGANAREKERTEDFSGTATVTPPAQQAPRPVAVKPIPTTTSTSQVAPGVTATMVANSVSGTASAEFRSWVASARLSGVFAGGNPRALINGRMVQPGQVVDEVLKVTFDKIESDGKTLVFRDATGATVSRKF